MASNIYNDEFYCAVQVENTMLIIGGERDKLTQVYPWGLRGIGRLPFKFTYGRCETFDLYLYL